MSTIGVTGATGHLGRHLVNHVVDLAAKRIKSGDGSASGCWQKQKSVIKTAA